MRFEKTVNLSDTQCAFLDGLCSAFDELPDGAWQAACCDAIERSGEFKGKDPFEVWLAWVETKSDAGHG